MIATKIPAPIPTNAPRSGRNKAKLIAPPPIASAGMKIFIPTLLYVFSTVSSEGAVIFPIFTFPKIAGTHIIKIRIPSTTAGIQRPNASTTPRTHQKIPVPIREGFSSSLAFLTPV